MPIDENTQLLEAKKSTDVMIGSYVSALDPAADDLSNSVLPGKFWVQVDGGGTALALKVRNAVNNGWTIIYDGGGKIGTASFTTASLGSGATATGTVNLAKSFILLRVATDYAARVRLYSTQDYRTDDASRAATSKPVPPHGVVIDTVTTSGSLIDDSMPKPVGCNQEPARSAAIPLSVQNLSGAARAISVNFVFLILEN